jgi:hypothetical protein
MSGLRADSPLSGWPVGRRVAQTAAHRPRSEELRVDADKDHTKTDASPQSTWGSTEAAKAAWDRKHGATARKAAAKDAAEKDEK